MKISVITPVHPTSLPFLQDAYVSLLGQTMTDFEWVIVPNNGAVVPPEIAGDWRVSIRVPQSETTSIGALKHFGFTAATGDVLVELDADDMLVENALQEIADVFADSRVAMAYSNSAEFEHDTWKPHTYSEYWGWRSRPFRWQGHDLVEMIAWPPSAQMMRRIEWAPNHVRAFSAQAYKAAGGHNPEIKTGDDHDLCCRMYVMYGASGVHHIDKCLYLYRVHGKNSCVTDNDAVQNQVAINYHKYIFDMAMRWTRDNRLAAYELGGRFNAVPGLTTVDRLDADVIADLERDWTFAPDNSAGLVRASHIFEHLKNPVHTMNELHRILAPGGFALIEVPSTDGRGAWQDPTHVSFWNQNSFMYYTNLQLAKYIQPESKARFQVSVVHTRYHSEFDKQNHVPIVTAHLIALKPPYDIRPVGEATI